MGRDVGDVMSLEEVEKDREGWRKVEDIWRQSRVLWKQTFDRDDIWCPHLTIMSVSARKQALIDRLRTGQGRASFMYELQKQARTVSRGVLLDGPRQIWPFVNLVLGKGGASVMSDVDREVEEYLSGMLDFSYETRERRMREVLSQGKKKKKTKLKRARRKK